MSDPNDPRESHLKCKFEELPKSRLLTAHVVYDLMLPDKYQLESADGISINIAHPSPALPTLITPSSARPVVDIAMPVTSKILFNLPAPK